jgi:hypothetical protein
MTSSKVGPLSLTFFPFANMQFETFMEKPSPWLVGRLAGGVCAWT